MSAELGTIKRTLALHTGRIAQKLKIRLSQLELGTANKSQIITIQLWNITANI